MTIEKLIRFQQKIEKENMVVLVFGLIVPKEKWFRNVGSAFNFRREDIYEHKKLYSISR